MTDTGDRFNDEIAVGVLGVIIATGFLKANELFACFDLLDLVHMSGGTLLVRGREFVAAVGFTGAYVTFLVTSAFALVAVARNRSQAPTWPALTIVSSVIGILVVVQFFALSAGFSHAMHKYSEAATSAQQVQWDFSAFK
jgi:hypothetical protein